jgi:hypothetical protein
MPADLYAAVQAIADVEGRAYFDQLLKFVQAGVAQWQAQHPH